MTYDKSSFLAGVAVGRQLKGWAAGAGRGVGFAYVATGERELVNLQGSSEYNYIQLPAGTRYCTMHIPGGNMYVFAASTEPFTMHAYTNNREETLAGSGQIQLGDRSYYYAYGEWYNPVPTPLVDCVSPVRSLNSTGLTAGQVVTQGILYLFGDR